ncbi:NEL-type E3 ubiquitin ligase domain-containing protein [Noviherbaspirillum malthae]|uniref:NEL-type E3 ubiquitin ligase domain-containing protein n=1 Tax=Noviherbaspirillum malthae TaxID=1260987 RepID=UPI00189088C9|nr:NEL-type E3 ubiquitin ligase domain-containing protein [Noviherbaspirillum malthae]
MSIDRAAISRNLGVPLASNEEQRGAATQRANTQPTTQPDAGAEHPKPASHLKKSLRKYLSSTNPVPFTLPDTHWSRTLDFSNVNFPNDVQPPEVEHAKRWITDLLGSSGEIRKRYSVGAGLYFHKPSSPRYQIAKREMSAIERTQLTAILRHLICQNNNELQSNSAELDEIVDLYLSVQHARLRMHTPEERLALRRHCAFYGVLGASLSLTGPYGPVFLLLGIEQIRIGRRNYYRSNRRPEYEKATSDMFEMISSPVCPQEIKLRIAGEILDHYMRSEKLLTQEHADSILETLNEGVPPRRAGQATGMNGQLRYTGMASIILRDRSTEEQQNRLVEWATVSNNWKYSVEPLEKMLDRLCMRINEMRIEDGSVSLPTSQEIIKALSKKPNAEEFVNLIQRAEKDANNAKKNRSNEVYYNIAQILSAIMHDSDFADRVFQDSVGGTQNCINNAMEYISELARRSKNRELVRGIVSGAMNLEQFKEASLANFRLETLDRYIATDILPRAIKNDQRLKGAYEPELAQTIKSDLITRLNLPKTVNPSSAAYPGKDRWHGRYVEDAENYVNEYTENKAEQQAFLETDPLWRDGVIELARQVPNSQDVSKLNRYTLELSNYTWDGSTAMDQYGELVREENLARAVRAASDLESLYTPRTGQKVFSVDKQGDDKYMTEIPAFQDLYDRIEALERQFKTAIQSVERQFASHVTRHVIESDGNLPADGGFQPDFKLPEHWEKEMQVLLPMSQAAELVEMSNNLYKKEEEIQQLRLRCKSKRDLLPSVIGAIDLSPYE